MLCQENMQTPQTEQGPEHARDKTYIAQGAEALLGQSVPHPLSRHGVGAAFLKRDNSLWAAHRLKTYVISVRLRQ
jgi:hypothetical protein